MRKPKGNKILHKLYAETGMQNVIEVLFSFPEKEFSLSDLAKDAGVAKANIGRILDELQRMEFIEITKLTKIWRIKANQKSVNFRNAKIVRNLRVTYQSGIIDALNDIYNNPKAIVLFGSFRKGDDISTSDVDIAVEVDFGEYKVVELKQLARFEDILGRKIQVHLFNRKTVDLNVFNNITNGIVLDGFLEVSP